MLIEVCKALYAEYPTAMAYQATKDNWVHTGPNNKERTCIAENVYVYSSASVKTIQTILRYLFEQLSVPAADLDFELKPINEKVVEEDNEE